MTTVLLIRPSYDKATTITSEWARDVADYAIKRGHKIVDLCGDLATPVKFLKAIKDEDPKMIFHYGHGKEDALLGQNGIPIISFENVHLMKGRLIYAVSCNSAKKLAEQFIKVGGIFYYGYRDRFLFDPYRHEIFKECVNAGPKALLEGKTTGEATKLVDQAYERNIRNLIQDEINTVKLGLQLLDEVSIPTSAEPLRIVLREAYGLRLDALQYEMKNFTSEKRVKIWPRILQAFRHIEFAESLKKEITIPNVKSNNFVSSMIDYAKRFWIVRCPRCYTINSTTSSYCSKCDYFLLYPDVD